MNKKEYTVVFHLINGEKIEVPASVNDSIDMYNVYRVVVEEDNIFYKVIDKKGVHHNIVKEHVVDISTYELDDTDIEALDL